MIFVALFVAFVWQFMKNRIYLHWNLFNLFVFRWSYFFSFLGKGSLQKDVHANSAVCSGENSQWRRLLLTSSCVRLFFLFIFSQLKFIQSTSENLSKSVPIPDIKRILQKALRSCDQPCVGACSDGFTHRPNPRAPRFCGPSATLSYDHSISTKQLRNYAEA